MIQATIKSYDPTKGWGYITTHKMGMFTFTGGPLKVAAGSQFKRDKQSRW